MSDKAILYVNGKIYEGWKEVEIKRSLKAASGSFSMSITDRWSGQNAPWIIAPGDAAEVRIGADVLITGYVDTVSSSMDKDARNISVSGRDKTADIIDCSVVSKTGEYANVTLLSLAQNLCAPFGISVAASQSTGAAFEVFKVQQGEAVFEALDRAARKRGFLLTSDTKGGLFITRPGSTRSNTRLQQGENIKVASSTFDSKERFSEYIVKGQDSGFTNEVDPAFAYAVKASAKDPTVARYRPLVIQSEQLTSIGDAKTRAGWEATTRAAKSGKFNITVQGWRQGDGSLWQPNQLILAYADWIGLNGEMLVTDVSYSLTSEQGTICVLSLERKDAYLPEPSVPEKTDPLAQAIKKDPGFKKANAR